MDKKKGSVKRFKSISPELIDLLISVLLRIVGESVKDRLIRAILVGALSAAGSYVAVDAPDPPVQSGLQK